MALAQVITTAAHHSWQANLEVPIAAGDARAADLVLRSARGTIHIEIERALVDFQAQMRSAQLKRAALAEREQRPLRLVIAVPDTRTTKARLAPFAPLISQTMPVSSRAIWQVIRGGEPLDGDGILFVRAPRQPGNRG